jgi:hypothetical protein
MKVKAGITIPLFMVKPGTAIAFPDRPRKKYKVRDHWQTYIKIRPGYSHEYADGRNYDPVPGTHLVASNGCTMVVESSKFVIEIA